MGEDCDNMEEDDGGVRTGGAIFGFCMEDGVPKFECRSRMEGRANIKMERALSKFMIRLEDAVAHYYPEGIVMRTEHTRFGNIFRGHPYYCGELWRDWVLVDWGEDGILPCGIWGFVCLDRLVPNSGINFGGLTDIDAGTYAIVESAVHSRINNEMKKSEILIPIRKEVAKIRDGFVAKERLYLADVESIVEPVAVVPDIGGPCNDYFVVKNWSQWREQFKEWLECNPKDYTVDESDDEDEQEQQNYESDDSSSN